MKVAVFSTKPYDRKFLSAANQASGNKHELRFFEPRLGLDTVQLGHGTAAVCAFVNDVLDRPVLKTLNARGIRLVALRCAGFNNVDLVAARELDIAVARVPAYSPEAVAEHTVALILSLNRKIHRAYARVREGNFALDGLIGFDLKGRTIGVVGTGKIGISLARIMRGFGCQMLGFDPRHDPEFIGLGGTYVELGDLFSRSGIRSPPNLGREHPSTVGDQRSIPITAPKFDPDQKTRGGPTLPLLIRNGSVAFRLMARWTRPVGLPRCLSRHPGEASGDHPPDLGVIKSTGE